MNWICPPRKLSICLEPNRDFGWFHEGLKAIDVISYPVLFDKKQKRISQCWRSLFGLINKKFHASYLSRFEYHLRVFVAIGSMHTGKSFRNLIKWNRNQIVFIIFRWICNQTDVRLVPNQTENGIYKLISVSFNKISKRFLCVYTLVKETGEQGFGLLFSILKKKKP